MKLYDKLLLLIQLICISIYIHGIASAIVEASRERLVKECSRTVRRGASSASWY